MAILKALAAAISTYSVISVPSMEWNEKNMRYAICFFPVVGIVCGVLLCILQKAVELFCISGFLTAAVAVCIPIFVSGGIHMDGFMDTADALSSHKTREEKLEIMKDSHCGAFSVMYCVVYFILNLAFVYEVVSGGRLFGLCPIYALSRSVSALCAVNMPSARKNGMLSFYTKHVNRTAVNFVLALNVAVFAAVMLVISPFSGAAALCLGGVWTAIYCRLAKKQFGGVTGDTAGFFLQIFELLCIVGVWIGAML